MTRSARSALLFLPLFAAATGGASPPRDRAVAATIDTSLTTHGEQIHQLAFDGDEASFFASQQTPTPTIHRPSPAPAPAGGSGSRPRRSGLRARPVRPYVGRAFEPDSIGDAELPRQHPPTSRID